jgi:acyl-[acyl-carrier-protein]-phospholipid O-acyltransferase/long-chain-fatty-acid--[acyl-carrier-protein] ligase
VAVGRGHTRLFSERFRPSGLPAAFPHRKTLVPRSSGFATLLLLRALTVVNDNLARWLVIGLGKRATAMAGTAPAAVLALGTVFYVLPFILFAWLAGWLADRFAKRSVVVAGKFAEVFIGAVTAVVIGWGAASGGVIAGIPVGLWLLLGAIGLFAIQTTLLNPSLIGTIPETVPSGRLSAANGVFAMVSLAATLVGMSAGNWLADATAIAPPHEQPAPPLGWLASIASGHAASAALGLVGVAVAGWLVSLRLPHIAAAAPTAAFPRNALLATFHDIASLMRLPRLAAAAGGIVYFWAIGAVVQLNVDQYAFESGATAQAQVVPLLLALVSGIGIGSLLAGRLSRRGIEVDSKVDLGLVPVGGLVMAAACGALALAPVEIFSGAASPALRLAPSVFWLAVLGIGAGMFDVPLEAYLQEQSPPERRGTVLASTNLLVFAGMLVSSIGYYGLRVPIGAGELARPLLSARGIFVVFSLLSVLATAVAIWAAPRASLRIVVAGLVNAVWRFRTRHEERVPLTGPLVMAANHLSWLDGFLLPLAAPRPVRMVVYGPNIKGRLLNRLADQWRFILFDPKPKSIGRALKTIQTGLTAGDCIGIFCEGGISRTGQIIGFKRGLEWLLERVESPILPVHIDGMWGSLLSFSEGRFFTKRPRGLRRPITLLFGDPLPAGTPPHEARLALQELSAESVRSRMLTAARRHPPGVAPGDWAAHLATAEAFDGCCLVRRDDRLLSSLSPGDPLHSSLGLHAAGLLGIAATAVEGSVPPHVMHEQLAATRATIWLATVDQVAALATGPSASLASLQVVVMPLAAAHQLPAAKAAAAAFLEAFGIEPVTAFVPREAGGLVAMNSPPARMVPHEVTLNRESVGRVVNGVVVWPRAADRGRLARPPLAAAPPGSGEETIVIGATLPGADGAQPRSLLLDEAFDVDADGFLVLREA